MHNREKINKLCLLAVLTAIICILSFTPLGYIKTFGLEMTLLVVPVVIGAILVGPTGGAYLGFVFGFTSLLQCVLGMSAFGVELLNINPFFTIVVCIVPRTLMGFLVGVIYKALKKVFIEKNVFAHIIACVSGALLNTLFFMTALVLFFYNTEFIQNIKGDLHASNVLTFVIAFVGLQGLIEAIINFIVGATVSKTLEVVAFKSK